MIRQAIDLDCGMSEREQARIMADARTPVALEEEDVD